jgi:hypothetical protein
MNYLLKKYRELEKQAEEMQNRKSATSEDIRIAWEKADKAYEEYLKGKKK